MIYTPAENANSCPYSIQSFVVVQMSMELDNAPRKEERIVGLLVILVVLLYTVYTSSSSARCLHKVCLSYTSRKDDKTFDSI